MGDFSDLFSSYFFSLLILHLDLLENFSYFNLYRSPGAADECFTMWVFNDRKGGDGLHFLSIYSHWFTESVEKSEAEKRGECCVLLCFLYSSFFYRFLLGQVIDGLGKASLLWYLMRKLSVIRGSITNFFSRVDCMHSGHRTGCFSFLISIFLLRRKYKKTPTKHFHCLHVYFCQN